MDNMFLTTEPIILTQNEEIDLQFNWILIDQVPLIEQIKHRKNNTENVIPVCDKIGGVWRIGF